MIAEVSAALLGGLVALGGWERYQRDTAHLAIPTRVHVNGTRGKSTVTRLIAAALRAHGCPTAAKTTGTAARLIRLDGSEVPVRRRSIPSIREQLWFLREARRLGARAVVIECMAIDPALQFVSEHDMVKATIGVITNARLDHADVMGSTVDAVAEALARTVPARGIVVLGQSLPASIFTEAAQRLGTRVIRADRRSVEPLADRPLPTWAVDNLAVALAVTRVLNIPDTAAWPAMMSAPEDPGALSLHTGTVAGRTITIVDGAAANDPESLQLILDDAAVDGERIFVFNHRADRPLRLRQFAETPIWKQPQVSVLITGDTPDCASRKAVGMALDAVRLGFAPLPLLVRALGEQLAGNTAIRSVVMCGNTRHLDVAAVVAALDEPGAASRRPASAGPGV